MQSKLARQIGAVSQRCSHRESLPPGVWWRARACLHTSYMCFHMTIVLVHSTCTHIHERKEYCFLGPKRVVARFVFFLIYFISGRKQLCCLLLEEFGLVFLCFCVCLFLFFVKPGCFLFLTILLCMSMFRKTCKPLGKFWAA